MTSPDPSPSSPALPTQHRWYDRRGEQLSATTAASRAEAYVYGNILVLATLATIRSEAVLSGQGALFAIGTAVSTYLAHVLAHWIGHQIRSEGRADSKHLREGIRNAVPIATSGLIPAAILLVGMWGWLEPLWALNLAIATIVVRFLVMGFVLGSLSGNKVSIASFVAGIALAVAGIIVVAVKVLLTH
jgi:tellurite resistance protein TehA-like permease